MRVPPACASRGSASTATITMRTVIFFTAHTSYLILRPVLCFRRSSEWPCSGGGGAVRAKRFDPGQHILEARIELLAERRGLGTVPRAARFLYGSRQVGQRGEAEIGGHPSEGMGGCAYLVKVHVKADRGQTVAVGARMLGQLRGELGHLGRPQRIDEQAHGGFV